MIDARGLSCPLPVVMTQKEIKKNSPATLEVIVDNICAVENITRFGENNGYKVAVENKDPDYVLKLSK